MSQSVSIRELKNSPASITERLDAGEVLTLTNRGRAVARLEPVSKARPYVTWDEVLKPVREAQSAPQHNLVIEDRERRRR